MKSISIRDIAQEVGVSTTTVSFVLNGKAREKRISEDLKEKILAVAKRLNYRPNQVARGLRTGQTHTLALMVEDISNPFFAHLARSVELEADKAGYQVMFCSTENNDEKAGNLLHSLKHRQMDGFIIIPTPGIRQEVEALVRDLKPVVLVDRFFPDLKTSSVTINNFKGVYDGVKLMLNNKRRHIALVTLLSDQVQMTDRNRGYHEALREHQGYESAPLILKIPYNLPFAEMASEIKSFLNKHPKTDGMFFTTNYLGVAGLEAIRSIEKKIPKDIAVVAFDDNDLFRLGSPAITVVDQPIQELGRISIELILKKLKDKNGPPEQIELPAMIVERESI